METKTVSIPGFGTLPLKYPFHSLFRMDAEHGLNVLDGESWTPSPKFLAIIIWGGLIDAKPELRLIDVTSGIALAEFHSVANTAMEVLLDSLPKKKEDGNPPAKV